MDPRQTSLFDQIGAAASEAHKLLADVAQRDPSARVEYRSPDDQRRVPVLSEVLDAIRAGELKACPHLASPQLVFIEVWKRPWAMQCAACLMFSTPPNETEDRTCDSCGRLCPDLVYPIQAQVGPFLVLWGLCETCRDVT